jgi:apolipoprotein N-acyltransferase
VPVAWVGMEYARAHFPTGFDFLTLVGLHQKVGFGWYFLGYSQHDFLPLLQLADLGGVYAVSAVVAAVNGLAAEWLMRWKDRRDAGPTDKPGLPRLLAATAGTAAVFAAAVGYGLVRLNHPEFAAGPRVAAIQGSVPQFQKDGDGRSLGAVYAALHLQAAMANPRPDLVVWPETCFPGDWLVAAPGAHPPPEAREQIARCAAYFAAQGWRVPTLLGLGSVEWEGDEAWKYNSALLLTALGEPVGRYDKIHLVPFGEYVPFRGTFPWLQMFTPYTHEYSCRPGERWTRFPVAAADGRRFTFACLICYEDSDPSLARRYVAPGGPPPVDFLVNVSNDGWFDGTEEHEQHLAICRFRAVECRRAVVRAVNMGISAVIDPDGRVVALPGPTWAASKKMEGVVAAVVPLDGRESVYARHGDWLPGACWIGILVGVTLGRFAGSRRL